MYIPVAAALLAVEVAYTTQRLDVKVKRPEYAAAGLVELWIVDLKARETLVCTQPSASQYLVETKVRFNEPIAVERAGGAELILEALGL